MADMLVRMSGCSDDDYMGQRSVLIGWINNDRNNGAYGVASCK